VPLEALQQMVPIVVLVAGRQAVQFGLYHFPLLQQALTLVHGESSWSPHKNPFSSTSV
jgi:hypothetical protein